MAWSLDRQMERNVEFFSPEAIASREAQKQLGRERLQGTYAQKAADEERMKGTFDQNTRFQKQMQGTWQQNAGLKRELEGTFADRQLGSETLEGMRGTNQMEQMKYQYGPESLAAQELNLKGELGRGGLEQGKIQFGSEIDLKKKALLSEGVAKATEAAAKLFPDDPAKAQAYVRGETIRLNQMFPELAPPPSGVGRWDSPPGGGAAVAAPGTMPDRSVDNTARLATVAPPPSRQVTGPPVGGVMSPGAPGHVDYFAPDPAEAALKRGARAIWDRMSRGSGEIYGSSTMEPSPSVPPPSSIPAPTPSAGSRFSVGPSLAFAGDVARPGAATKSRSTFSRMVSPVDLLDTRSYIRNEDIFGSGRAGGRPGK